MSTENTINEAANPDCFLGAVGSSLVLYHGTNRTFSNLRSESFLSAEVQDAVFFAELKNGGTVYQFIVSPDDVYRDTGTPQKEWYLSRKKLKPVRCWSL